LDWPGDILSRVERGLLDLREVRLPDDSDWAELVARGLASPDGWLSGLGLTIDHHLAEPGRQVVDDFISPGVLDRMSLGAGPVSWMLAAAPARRSANSRRGGRSAS